MDSPTEAATHTPGTSLHGDVSPVVEPLTPIALRPDPMVPGEQSVLQEETLGPQPPFMGPTEPQVGQFGPERAETRSELEEMRRWLKAAEEHEELKALRELRRLYNEGDPTTLLTLQKGLSQARVSLSSSTSNLPRPEPPQVYSKKSRAEYNRWERDCEGYFLRVPLSFNTEAKKVDFGVRYIAEKLKSLWAAHCLSAKNQFPTWTPTWVTLKKVMLNALGTPGERRQNAYNMIKHCKQRPGQSPTDLLDYMRPLWEELGPTHLEDMQVLEYMAALNNSIQLDLYLIPHERRSTIPAMEEQANIIYRRQPLKGSARAASPKEPGRAAKNNSKKHRKNISGSEGDEKTPKNDNGTKRGFADPKRANRRPFRPPGLKPTCFACGEVGHIRPNCPNGLASKKDNGKPLSGKEKG